MSRSFDSLELLLAPLYFIAVLLIATPMMDFATSVLPLRLESIEWRFATVGLLSGFLLTPLLGILIAIALAAYADHLRFLRVLSIVNGVGAVLFVALLIFFALDVIQLRSVVQEQAKAQFQAAAVKAVVKHATFILALGWLSVRGYRASRWSVPSSRRVPSVAVRV
jgi:hypothetical protein